MIPAAILHASRELMKIRGRAERGKRQRARRCCGKNQRPAGQAPKVAAVGLFLPSLGAWAGGVQPYPAATKPLGRSLPPSLSLSLCVDGDGRGWVQASAALQVSLAPLPRSCAQRLSTKWPGKSERRGVGGRKSNTSRAHLAPPKAASGPRDDCLKEAPPARLPPASPQGALSRKRAVVGPRPPNQEIAAPASRLWPAALQADRASQPMAWAWAVPRPSPSTPQ